MNFIGLMVVMCFCRHFAGCGTWLAREWLDMGPKERVLPGSLLTTLKRRKNQISKIIDLHIKDCIAKIYVMGT